MDHLTLKVCQLLRRFSQNGRLLDSFSLGTAIPYFMKIQQMVKSLILCDRRTDGRLCSALNTLYFDDSLTIMQLRDLEKRVVEN
jgi:hypothetical protein